MDGYQSDTDTAIHMIYIYCNAYTRQVFPCPIPVEVEPPSFLTMSDLAVIRVSTAIKS